MDILQVNYLQSVSTVLYTDMVGTWSFLFNNATPDQLKTICTCFRGSLIAQFIQFICMHFMIIASLFVVRENIPSKNLTLQHIRTLRSVVSEVGDQSAPLLPESNSMINETMDRVNTIDQQLANSVAKDYRVTRASRGVSLSYYNQNTRPGHLSGQQSGVLENIAMFDPSLEK